MALNKYKNAVIIALVMYAVSMFLFGFIFYYMQPADDLMELYDNHGNMDSERRKQQSTIDGKLSERIWGLPILFLLTSALTFVGVAVLAADVIDMIHDAKLNGLIRNFILSFILMTIANTITSYKWRKWVVEWKYLIIFLRDDRHVVSAKEICDWVNFPYIVLNAPFLPTMYTFCMCFLALYAYHRLSKSTGYSSLDAANRKLMYFFQLYSLLSIILTGGLIFTKTDVDVAVVLVGMARGMAISICSAFAVIAVLDWWEGPNLPARPNTLLFLRETTTLYEGRQITLRLYEKPRWSIEPIPNAN